MNGLKNNTPQEEQKQPVEGSLPDSEESYDDPDPMAPFDANLEVEGMVYRVTVQAFFPADGNRQARYRVRYGDKSEKVIDYKIGIGWVEEGGETTPHALAVGKLIEERFS